MSHGEVHALEEGDVHGNNVFVSGGEAQHIVKALRHRPGDELRFSVGDGQFLHVRLDRVGTDGVHGEILRREVDPRESDAPWSFLGLALLKGDHFDLALEKAVELGVHEVWPLIADHCVVKWKPGSGAKKLGRWQRVVESAMKQSGRSWRPRVREPQTALDAVVRFRAEFGDDARVLVADEDPAAAPLDARWKASSPRMALVGPEGGFSEREKSELASAGVASFTLGPFRLRAETAAMTAVYTLNRGMS